MPTLSKAQTLKAVQRLGAIDARFKDLYAERDSIESRLIESIRATKAGAIPLADGSMVMLKDNFEDRDGNPRNVAFKTAAVKRYEVVVKSGA